MRAPKNTAPHALCELYARVQAEPFLLSNDQISALRLLLEDKRMGEVWGDLKSRARKADDSGSPFAVCWEERFAYTVFEARQGPQGEEKQSRRKQYKRLDEVRDTARKLSSLVKDTSWDDYLLQQCAVLDVKRTNGPAELAMKFSDFLVRFADLVEIPKMRLSVLGKPTSVRAARTYFERRLLDYFVSEFGAPTHSLVAIVARVVFQEAEPKLSKENDNRVRQLKQSANALKQIPDTDERESARKQEAADILKMFLPEGKKRKR